MLNWAGGSSQISPVRCAEGEQSWPAQKSLARILPGWRRSHRAPFANAHLANADLRGVYLKRASLRAANLESAREIRDESVRTANTNDPAGGKIGPSQ
ncbi:MAG: pentapeptide repeat-containing protein [Candidatus Velthaea sp.]